MEEWKWDSSVAFLLGEGGRGACPAKLFQRLFRVSDIRTADAGVKRSWFMLCLSCCTKLFCPLFRATDIRFSKCSGYSVEGRTQPDYIRHRGSSNPCLDIVSKHCWNCTEH